MKKRAYITPVGDEGLYILDTGSWRNYQPVIDREKCTDCGLCFIYCPVSSIVKKDGHFSVDLSYCKGCGICARECPTRAMKMIAEEGDSDE